MKAGTTDFCADECGTLTVSFANALNEPRRFLAMTCGAQHSAIHERVIPAVLAFNIVVELELPDAETCAAHFTCTISAREGFGFRPLGKFEALGHAARSPRMAGSDHAIP